MLSNFDRQFLAGIKITFDDARMDLLAATSDFHMAKTDRQLVEQSPDESIDPQTTRDLFEDVMRARRATAPPGRPNINWDAPMAEIEEQFRRAHYTHEAADSYIVTLAGRTMSHIRAALQLAAQLILHKGATQVTWKVPPPQ